MDLTKELEEMRCDIKAILAAVSVDENEILNSDEIIKELKISKSTLYSPKVKFELRQFGMSTTGPLRIMRKDLEAYKKFKVK